MSPRAGRVIPAKIRQRLFALHRVRHDAIEVLGPPVFDSLMAHPLVRSAMVRTKPLFVVFGALQTGQDRDWAACPTDLAFAFAAPPPFRRGLSPPTLLAALLALVGPVAHNIAAACSTSSAKSKSSMARRLPDKEPHVAKVPSGEAANAASRATELAT